MARLVILIVGTLLALASCGFADLILRRSNDFTDLLEHESFTKDYNNQTTNDMTYLESGHVHATMAFVQGLLLNSLDKRQMRCPSGTYPCNNGKCCPTGTTCTTTGCCPGTKIKCGASGCYDPASEVCCGASGETCKRGFTCEAGGCCHTGTKPCGPQNCYDPKTKVCCPSGRTCDLGYDCMEGGGCCPEGLKKCGTSSCYNPKTETCCPSGRASKKGYTCVEKGGCCPDGQERCGNSKCYDPKRQNCCTSPGYAWGCPKASVCCSDAKSCAIAGEERCCSNGACPIQDTCCDLECCQLNASCGSNGRCTLRSTSKPSSSRSKSSSSSSTSSRGSQTRLPSTSKTISSTACPSSPTGLAKRGARERFCGSKGNDPGEYMEFRGKCLPIMDFPCVPGLTDQLCASMCAGIKAQRTKRPSLVLSDTIMVLTYAGPDKQGQKDRRREAKCKDYCSGQRSPQNERLECDEFPPACAIEGGDGASRMCIPASQNSKLQGPMINCYLEFYDLKINEQFIVRMGSCPSRSTTKRKLHAARDTLNDRHNGTIQKNNDGILTLSSDVTEWMANPYTGETKGAGHGSGFIVMSLVNLTEGKYAATLNFSTLQGIQNLAVVDGDGYAYWMKGDDELDGTHFAPYFDLDDDSNNLVVAAAASRSISVSATLKATITPSTGSSSATRAVINGGGTTSQWLRVFWIVGFMLSLLLV